MHVETRKECLEWCCGMLALRPERGVWGGVVGVSSGEECSRFGLMGCLRAVCGDPVCGEADGATTTDPIRAHGQPLRCAVGRAACQRFSYCVPSPCPGRGQVARSSPDSRGLAP